MILNALLMRDPVMCLNMFKGEFEEYINIIYLNTYINTYIHIYTCTYTHKIRDAEMNLPIDCITHAISYRVIKYHVMMYV